MISQSLTPHCYYIVVLHYGSDICQIKLLFCYKASGCQPQCLFQDSNIGGELANLEGEILYLRYDLLQNPRIWEGVSLPNSSEINTWFALLHMSYILYAGIYIYIHKEFCVGKSKMKTVLYYSYNTVRCEQCYIIHLQNQICVWQRTGRFSKGF